MPAPYDYSGAFAPQDPQQAMMQGVRDGAFMQQLSQKRQADAIALQQSQQAAIQKQQMETELGALSENPTSEAIAKFAVKYPQLSESMKRSFDMVEPAQKQAKLEHLTQVYSAFNANQPEIAADIMQKHAEALRNSGDERGAGATEAMIKAFRMDPTFAKIQTGNMLAAMAGPEKFGETFGKVGNEERADEQAPGQLKKTNADADAAVADAETKKITAKYADSKAIQDLAKTGWDIKKIAADIDIAKESNRIAAMNAAASREGNSLKRQELQLKIDDALTARDDKIREKTSKAESGINAMDNMLNTIQRVLKNPALNDVVGSLEGSAMYPNGAVASASAMNPFTTSSDDRADAIAMIETLGSQAFLSQVPTVQGMGSLSNAEGEKLQSALQNLSRKQSEKQFRGNLEEATRLIMKSRENVSKRYGAPLPTPDTPAVRNSRPPLSSFEGG